MTEYEIAHGLSQDAPGPLEPVSAPTSHPIPTGATGERDWELSCDECNGSGHVFVKHQVAERKTDVQEFKEECEACEGRGFNIAFEDIPGIAEYVKSCRAAPAAGDALAVAPASPWRDIMTAEDSDDLIWLYDCSNNSIDGPRTLCASDVDWYTHWAPCEAPETSRAALAEREQFLVHGPVGRISHDTLNELVNPEWQKKRNTPAQLWTINSPPSRAVLEVYVRAKQDEFDTALAAIAQQKGEA